MKIIIDKPIFRGEYFTMDTPEERLILKKGCFYQKPFSGLDPNGVLVDSPGRYYFIICLKQDNKFWQEAWQCPKFEDDTRWSGNFAAIDKVRSPEQAYTLFIENFDWKNKTIAINGKRKKFDAIMPRTKIPEAYKEYMILAE